MQAIREKVYIEKQIISTLRYFHLFKHPLPVEDIYKYTPVSTDIEELNEVLTNLLDNNLVFKHNNFYMLADDISLAKKRDRGADIAKKRLPKAIKSAKIIAQFPFVSGICISGSLSKNYADDKSDIDFFIITKTKRLWIARTLLHVFKKFTFLINKQHSFCMNYFIDESQLELEEKNRFTATELVTLIPVYNTEVYKTLLNMNKNWVEKELPNATWNSDYTAENKTTAIKSFLEYILNILWPLKMNEWLMKLTDIKWRKKWSKRNYPMEDYDLAMKTKWYVSKHHPTNYQKKILNNIDNAT